MFFTSEAGVSSLVHVIFCVVRTPSIPCSRSRCLFETFLWQANAFGCLPYGNYVPVPFLNYFYFIFVPSVTLHSRKSDPWITQDRAGTAWSARWWGTTRTPWSTMDSSMPGTKICCFCRVLKGLCHEVKNFLDGLRNQISTFCIYSDIGSS